MKTLLWFFFAGMTMLPAAAQISGGTCTASSLSGAYALSFNGRAISGAGALTASLRAAGTVTFDGQSNASFTLTSDTNHASGTPLAFSGIYTMLSTCAGTITVTGGSAATFAIVVYNQGKNFALSGQDAAYVYSGTGTLAPAACITASLSGVYAFTANGDALSGGSITGVADANGVIQFDGQGNLSATYTVSSGGALTPMTATGTYSVAAGCTGSGSMTDSSSVAYSLSFAIDQAQFENFTLTAASSQLLLSGTAHSTFVNPNVGVVNVSSYAPNYTPPGSVFAVFGENLAIGLGQPSGLPLPKLLRTTTVTVNGEAAPLFYVNTLQIDAQMPWDVTPGWSTVVVKNGVSSSAAAVYVPATGTPGISFYGNNRAVVVNSDGVTLNGPSTPANVGDEVVAYFTGGGPVSSTPPSGAGTPGAQTPITEKATVTVNGANAPIDYIGLTQGGVGLYQVNFHIPQLAKGSYPLQIIVDGQKSNLPSIAVGN